MGRAQGCLSAAAHATPNTSFSSELHTRTQGSQTSPRPRGPRAPRAPPVCPRPSSLLASASATLRSSYHCRPAIPRPCLRHQPLGHSHPQRWPWSPGAQQEPCLPHTLDPERSSRCRPSPATCHLCLYLPCLRHCCPLLAPGDSPVPQASPPRARPPHAPSPPREPCLPLSSGLPQPREPSPLPGQLLLTVTPHPRCPLPPLGERL